MRSNAFDVRNTIRVEGSTGRSSNPGVNFLLVDLDTALTFMDVAHSTHLPETATRNHDNARRAYETVRRLLPRVGADAVQQQTIREKLAYLRTRLETVGQQF